MKTVVFPVSSVLMASIAFALISKSKMLKFSTILSFLTDSGITDIPLCVSQRKMSCAERIIAGRGVNEKSHTQNGYGHEFLLNRRVCYSPMTTSNGNMNFSAICWLVNTPISGSIKFFSLSMLFLCFGYNLRDVEYPLEHLFLHEHRLPAGRDTPSLTGKLLSKRRSACRGSR